MDIIKKLSGLLNRAQKIKIGIIMFMLLISGILETVGVSMILPLLEAILDQEKFLKNPIVKWIMTFLAIEDIETFILVILLALIGIYLVKNIYLLFVTYIQARFVNRNRCVASKNLLSQYLHRPYEYYLNAETATILRTIYGDMDNVFNLLLQCMNLAAEAIVAVCVGTFLFIVDFKMAIMMIFLLGVTTIFITKILKPRLGAAGENSRYEQSMQYKWILESVAGIKDVKVLHKESYFVDKYEQNASNFGFHQVIYNVLSTAPRLLVETIPIVGILGYIAISILAGANINSLLTLMTAFAMGAVRLLPSVSRINTYMANIMYYKTALDNIYETVDMRLVEKQEKLDKANKNKISEKAITITNSILLDQITYAYPNTTKKIFDNAKMEIPVGKSIGVIGTSGSGKSTIIDVLLGLLKLQKGLITSDGKDIFSNYTDWLSHIGYIPQSIYMLDNSIRHNIAFGVHTDDIDDNRIWEVLKEAQLEEFVKQLPEGLDTAIGERGVRISGGQRQRLGIARALYHNPELLVFDEATSALDNDTETAIMEAVDRLHGNKTLVIIAHRLRTLENCDMIYEVKDGKITLTSLEEKQ